MRVDRYSGVKGEKLPSGQQPDWLALEHVLQRYRDVWEVTDTYPFLAVDVGRLNSLSAGLSEFPVFSSGRLLQNLRPEEMGERLIAVLAGPGLNAGMNPEAEIVVEGTANPSAHMVQFFNDPFGIGMHPFAALQDRYIYLDENGIYQRKFAELVTVDEHSRPRSPHVDFDPLAKLALEFHRQFIDGPQDQARDTYQLHVLMDRMFEENEKILAAAAEHHRCSVPLETSFNYVAPKLTRYGRLTHDANRQPRIEISFALLHYEKALHSFGDLKAALRAGNTEAAFVHGIYCVVAVAACVEAVANRLVFLCDRTSPDHRPWGKPLTKINKAAAALAAASGREFVRLEEGMPTFDTLDKVRMLRNEFMHSNEQGEAVDPVALTSIVFTAVDEQSCRYYLGQLRLAVAHVFDQLSDVAPPIVTRSNVKWLGDLEVP